MATRVLLDNVRSALNVGSVFRTAEGAGVEMLYLTGITPYPPHPKIKKTALGADEYLKFHYEKDPLIVISELKAQGFQIISVEQSKTSYSYFNHSFTDNTLLIFGNEITGVQPKLLELCDAVVELPMLGKKNSLNVSNTVAIMLYHLMYLDNLKHEEKKS